MSMVHFKQFKYRKHVLTWIMYLFFGYWAFFFLCEGLDYLIGRGGNPNSSYSSDVYVTPVTVVSNNGCTGGKGSTCSYTIKWPNNDHFYIQSSTAYAVGQTIYHSAWSNTIGQTFTRYSWSPVENKTPPTWLSKFFMKDNHVKPEKD